MRDDAVVISIDEDEQDHVRDSFRSLTPREQDVLWGLMQGMSLRDIMAAHYVERCTVQSQVKGILRKLHVHSQVAAVALAYRAGWTPEVQEM